MEMSGIKSRIAESLTEACGYSPLTKVISEEEVNRILSEGEKLDLCIDVAIQNPNGLNIILIDGVEKLATDLREKLYQKCKNKGLQFIATRTTDDDTMTVVTL